MVDQPTVRCPACGADNATTQKFCGECGARLVLVCPACNHQNAAGQKFCGECGAKLGAPATPPLAVAPTPVETDTAPAAPRSGSAFREAAPAAYTPKHLAEKILTSRSAIEGERKQVTVMFTDVSGFTAMSERLDPEEVHAIMDRVFEVILGAVHAYEGTINQFLGDGVMALFGAPIAHEDHAGRALRAALAIQEKLAPVRADVQRQHGQDFLMRIGLNSGPVVVGAIGRDLRMDYTAVGDTVNLAARLLNVAQPGQIVASRHAKELCQGFFVFDDLGDFQVKGKTEPQRAFAVKSEIGGRTRLEVSRERGLTPLIGRATERARLVETFQGASDGVGCVVVISGDPGVGKSRLLYEFLRGLDERGPLELETTCASYGRAMAYRPLVELYRRYLDLSEELSPDDVRRRVAARLVALDLEGDEPAFLLHHFLGLPVPPEFLLRVQGARLRDLTNEVLRTLILRESTRQPVVLVVENMHWVDASSEDFLKALAQEVRDHRVLLVLTTRPGSAMEWLPPETVTLKLEGLDPADLRDMVRALCGAREVSEPLFHLLLAKGEGNPLYVEEIVRQLQETEGIVVENGEARLRAADVTVPETIRDIIAARVDRLAESPKQTLQVASVVGRRFGVSLVSHVREAKPDHVAGDLKNLHAVDFVFPAANDPELMYSFKHALTQDVVYTSLLERRRRRFHAAAGRGLEELYAGRLDEVIELLAYHFGLSEEAEKAVDYAILAAAKAQRRWANTEALAYFASSLKRLESMPDTPPNRMRRIDAVVKQSEIMFALGRHAEHVQALEAIRHLIEQTADPPRRAAWYCWTGFLHSLTGAGTDVPIAYCREASAIAEANGLDEIRAIAECCLTHVSVLAGNLREALEAGERALAAFEAWGNVWWACRTLWGLSMAANASGEWARSLEYCRRALEHGKEVNDLRLKVVGWWRTGSTHVQQGDVEAGLRCYKEALALSPIPFDAAMARAGRAYGLVKAGDVAAGVAALEEAVAWFDQSNLRFSLSSWSLRLVEGYIKMGERSRAREVVVRVLATCHEFGHRHLEGAAERLLGEILASEDPSVAAAHLEAAVRTLEDVGARDELARALVAQASLRRLAGDRAGARQLLGRALALFEELGTVDEPAHVRAALAALDSGDVKPGLVVSRDEQNP
jgi:class 3 adenylate cyclase/tetratricopeptide (TPR) repeat protein